MRWFEHKYTRYYSKGKHCKKGNLFTEEWFKDIMVFFTNRRKNRNCPFLKTLHFNPHYSESIELPLSKTGPLPHQTFQINFHHFFIHGPGFPEKSLGTSHRGQVFWPAIENETTKLEIPSTLPNPNPPLWGSVITVRQCLVLCWEQRGRLSLPDSVLLVRSCLVHRRGGTCNWCWWRTAEHPHSQRVIRKLSWTCWRRPVFPRPPWCLPVEIPFRMYRGDWWGPLGS